MNTCVMCLSEYASAKMSYEVEVNDVLRYVTVALCMNCWEGWVNDGGDLAVQYKKLNKASKQRRKDERAKLRTEIKRK